MSEQQSQPMTPACPTPGPAEAHAEDVFVRTLAIIRALYDLKEDVLFSKHEIQPEFDAGMLEAARMILEQNIDQDDPRYVAEQRRQFEARALRILTPESQSTARKYAVGQPAYVPTYKKRAEAAEANCAALAVVLAEMKQAEDNLTRELESASRALGEQGMLRGRRGVIQRWLPKLRAALATASTPVQEARCAALIDQLGAFALDLLADADVSDATGHVCCAQTRRRDADRLAALLGAASTRKG